MQPVVAAVRDRPAPAAAAAPLRLTAEQNPRRTTAMRAIIRRTLATFGLIKSRDAS